MSRLGPKLINFHSSGNTEVPLELLEYGEIAVRHYSADTGAELIIKTSESTSAIFIESGKIASMISDIDCGSWEEEPPTPAHEYIDLGLPSGRKWATCNIGAETPTEKGLYFAWGEISGYTASQVGSKRNFNQQNYRFYSASTMTKYNASDGKTVLDAEDDAATANWGSDWRMPTREEMIELSANTISRFITAEQVVVFSSKTNDNVLILPVGGYATGNNITGITEYADYWSNTRSSNVSNAARLFRGGSSTNVSDLSRWYGMFIRPVLK